MSVQYRHHLLLAGAPSRSNAARAPPPDFSKVEIKTTDLGDNVYMLEGQGGNITVAVGRNAIIMVDGEFAPLHDKIKAAVAAVSNLPIKYLVNTLLRRPYRRQTHLGNAKDGVTGSSPRPTSRTPPAPPPRRLRPLDRRQGTWRRQRCPKTYTGSSSHQWLPGRVAELKHIANAHTDGDTYVWFKSSNVLSTGDTFTNGRYPNIDFANGGNIKGMIAGIRNRKI